MGSLICGLLLVIAISCTCKLIALRNVELQTAAGDERGSSDTPRVGGVTYPRAFPFPCNDSDTPLFRLEHEFFYREPPPSYAAAVGVQADATPYDRDRQNRRQQRRQLRRNRRRPPSPPPLLAEDNTPVGGTSSMVQALVPPTTASHDDAPTSDKDAAKPSDTAAPASGAGDTHNSSTSSAGDVSIELDSIPSPTNIGDSCCDEEPLLS